MFDPRRSVLHNSLQRNFPSGLCTIRCTELAHTSPRTMILPAARNSILLKTRNPVYEPEGRGFDSLRARHFSSVNIWLP